MKRRHFLQFAGSTLAVLGLSQTDFLNQAEGYGRAIAQSTPRKLALLVGVNDYPGSIPDLRGCLTDVDLQYELLVNKFGFNPADVLKVSDSEAIKPTRQNVLDAYEEHLVKQAKPGDVVVFHYSGHGVPVKDPDPIYEGSDENGAIILNDPLAGSSLGAPQLPVIMGRTLFLLSRSLQTNNVTTILDSCHSGGGTRGNGLVRAIPRDLLRTGSSSYEAIPSEFELQRQLLAEQGLSPEDFLAARKAGIANGLSIGSAQFSELALDAPFDGFQAGAFSYLLTRYLWQLSGTTRAESVRANITRSTKAAAAAKYHSQVPLFQSAPNSDSLEAPIYFTPPASGPAEAVVTSTSGDQIEYWLGGLSSQSLTLSNEALRFTVLDATREPVAEIEQVSRNGLRAIGKKLSGSGQITQGMLLRETLVGLESNPQLRIGVDASLGEDVNDAIAALSNALVSESSGRSQLAVAAVDGTTPFDYIFGRMTEEYRAELIAEGREETLPPAMTLSLFSPAMEPTPASYGRIDETISSAVNRLKPQLKLLLVNKVLNALSNTASSLPVSGEIFTVGEGPSLPLSGSKEDLRSSAASVEPFRAGSQLRIRVKNSDSNQALYLSCLVIDPAGKITVVYPYEWDAPEDAALISPNSEVVIPEPETGKAFEVGGAGFLEVMAITSTGSLRNALRGLQEISRSADGYVPVDGDDSIGFLGSLLSDFDNISRNATFGVADVDKSTRVVDGGAIAISSTVIEVA